MVSLTPQKEGVIRSSPYRPLHERLGSKLPANTVTCFDELDRFDAVILDPPRAGAKEPVEQLAKSRVACIAYASCNPSTFARDAKLLIDAGYRLDSIKPVGQFRWSTHVELAATFNR